MGQFQKHFTLTAARAILPELRRQLLRIQNLLAELKAESEQTGSALPFIMRGNGKGPIVTQVTSDRQSEAQKLIESIAGQGIQIKDLERGLVDFPHYLAGDQEREVFLCWHLGEDTIEFWHEIEAGYGGRQLL